MLLQRSQEKEILDLGPEHYTSEEFKHCQKNLFQVNKFLGCFNGTAKLLKKLPQTSTITDVGCGGGLFILNLSKLFPKMKFNGIDISSEAIDMAINEKEKFESGAINVTFKYMSNTSLDYKENSVDIILATMVCHHMSNKEMVLFIKQAIHTVKNQVIINDLHRNSIAYWFYRIFSPIMFRDRLITHDGLISIKRGFIRPELKKILREAGINNYQIKWCFPFRWRIIIWKK